MTGWLDVMRLVAEPTRVRILGVLRDVSLSVAELQEVFAMGQSRVSMHLRALRKAGLLEDHRDGQRVYYRWREALSADVVDLVNRAWKEGVDAAQRERDAARVAAVLRKRRELSESYFQEMAERSRDYAPGRGWHALSRVFLELIGTGGGVLADMGSGEGFVTLLVAPHMRKVIAVDLSEQMLNKAREEAARLGLQNIEFRQGDIESPPLAEAEVDVCLFSQALHHAADPGRAVAAAQASLRPGGKMIVLDVLQHQFEDARTLYGDVWLGFAGQQIERWLRDAGLCDVQVRELPTEQEEPHFTPVLATGRKPT